MESITHIPWQVEVFTLSTRAWRSPCSGNLPRKSVQFCWEQVVVDGLLYWLAIDGIAMDGGFRHYNLIISFDMTSEEFREVNLPDSLACVFGYKLSMSKLRESLAVLKHCEWATSVWMMQDGVPKSFTKLFTFNAPHASLRGFGKSGEPIIQTVELNRGFPYCPYSCSFAVYEPDTKQINNLWIMGFVNLFSVYPYMETLLLLDQPDSIIYDKGKGNNSKSRAKNKRILKHTRKSQNSSSQKQLICSFVG
ncbi:hypothetical protein L1987_46240 [Smallanthus sonchifolius]|uniref:Uncharacterized protein n=1 Tax=Smallanthus sonchifolius TaxID=185202 RepID=A0ACB9G063_9ASTR|nr:hypothetical protein L1987_46240 [Smallanthus sonchifolius]